MSSPVQYLTAQDGISCQRCKDNLACLVSRKENFCENCFIRFIRGKQRKQMLHERFKVAYPKKNEKVIKEKVLLALSYGMSSISVLDVIIALLKDQREMHNGRQGFELVVVNIDEYDLKTLDKRGSDLVNDIKKHMGESEIIFESLDLDTYILDQDSIGKISSRGGFNFSSEVVPTDQSITVTNLLKYCANKSSAEDLLTIVKEEMIMRSAYKHRCNTILYGHCNTRLANEVISLTIKGRGSVLHEEIVDRSVTFHGKEINIIFPLRDVLFAEIEAYIKLRGLSRFEINTTIPLSKISKNLTIGQLTANYFKRLDETGYASTASTVVKTAEKLGLPKLTAPSGCCEVCGATIYSNPRKWLSRITVQEPCPPLSSLEETERRFYHKEFNIGSNDASDQYNGPLILLCYGCTITFSHIASEGMYWPIETPQLKEKEILDQYILTDDDSDT